MNWAIINKKTEEFYADPIYTDKKKGLEKIVYLTDYRIEKNMEKVDYVLERLTKEREEQHEQEWKQFCNAMD